MDAGSEPPTRGRREAAVLRALPHAVLLLDDRLRVTEHNGVAHAWLGLPDDADLTSAVHPDDRTVLLAAEAEFRASPAGWSSPVPVRVRHADGSWHTWSVRADNRLADPEVGAIVVLARDTTGSLGPSSAIDAVLREMASAAPVASVVLDRHGRIRLATGAALHFDPEQMVGRRLADFVVADEHRAMITKAIGGDPVDELTVWNDRWWQIRYTPLVRDGRPDGAVGVFLDVTDRALAEQALTASEAHLRGVIEAAKEALVVVDEDGCITVCNTRFGLLFEGGTPGNDLREVVGDRVADLLRDQLDGGAGRGGGRRDRRELRITTPAGEPVWLLVSGNRLRDDEGRRVGSVLVLTDITAQKDAERRLTLAARTDPVTGVGNRSTLMDRLDQSLARRGGTVALLFLDVDGLKAVNDTHGHAAGDALLRHVAERARSALRPADTLVRYGGDEFVAVSDDLPDPGEAEDLAERLRRAIATPLVVESGVEVVPTVSVGVATSPPREGAADLLAAADAAVYAAKAAGRDCVRYDA